MKKLAKWLVIIALTLAALTVAGVFAITKYEQAKSEERRAKIDESLTKWATPSFVTDDGHRVDHGSWEWVGSYPVSTSVQKRASVITLDDGRTDTRMYLRRVYHDHWVRARVFREEDNTLSLAADVRFPVDCKVDAEVETSVTYSNGDPFTLTCKESRSGYTYLTTQVYWDDVEMDDLPIWSDDFDGFAVSERFNTWDFTEQLKYQTLNRLKVPSEDKDASSEK